jgi:hypothetical protein
MVVIVGIFIVAAMVVTLSGSVFTDIKLFGLLREQQRTIPKEVRRKTMLVFAVLAPLEAGYLAFLFVIAPFGRRATVIWFLIVPFLIVVPLWTIFVGVRAYRTGRHPTSGD